MGTGSTSMAPDYCLLAAMARVPPQRASTPSSIEFPNGESASDRTDARQLIAQAEQALTDRPATPDRLVRFHSALDYSESEGDEDLSADLGESLHDLPQSTGHSSTLPGRSDEGGVTENTEPHTPNSDEPL